MKKASKDVFDHFFNNSIDLLCIAGTNGNFIKLNSEWERTLGYALSEMEGRPFIDFVHPDDIKKTISATSSLAKNKPVRNFINRYRHKDGSYRWIEWRSFPSEGKIYASARDITKHVETEQALKKSEQRNALISSLLTDYVFKFEVSEKRSLKLVYIYDNLARLTGKSTLNAQDFKNLTGIIHTDDYPRVMGFLKQMILNGIPNEMECRGRARDSQQWISIIAKPETDELTGRVVNITGAIKDISEHKGAELNLKSSEEKFLKAFMYSPDMVSIIDCKSNIFVDANEVLIKSSGYQRHEIIGKTATELNFWSDIKDRDNLLKILHKDKRLQNFETKQRTRSGEIRDCLITAEIIEVNNEKKYLFFTRDITDEKKTAEALAKSEQKFSDFFYLSPNIIGLTRRSDGKVLEINNINQELFGFTHEEILGNTSLDLKIWGSDNEHQKILEKLADKGEVRNFEINIASKNGKIIPCFLSAKTITYNDEPCVLFVINDVSDKKKSENALSESEQRLRSFINKTSEGVVIINEFGIIEEWNNSAESITGISRNNIINQNWEESALFFNPNSKQSDKSRAQIRKKIVNALSSGKIDKQTYDLHLIHTPSGRTKYLEEKMFTIKTEVGYRLAVIFNDITERKEAEEIIAGERNILRALVDNIPDIVYVKDTDSRFIITNSTLAKILNTSVENILGKTDFDFFPAVVAQHFFNDEQLLIQTGVPVINKEEIIFDPQGNTVMLQTTKLPLYDKAGGITGIVGTGHIITEQKQYEEALRKSEDLLKGITQNIPGMVFQLYADKDGDYGLNFISERSLEYLGLENKNKESIYKGFVTGIVDADRPRLISSIQDAIATVSQWKYEGKYIRPDGSERYFRGESQPRMINNKLVFDGILLDITQSWKAVQELADARAILETAINQSPIPMLLVSMPDFIIRISNKACSEFLGVTDESEFVGKSFININQTWLEFDENGHPVPPQEMPISLALKGIEIKNKEYFVIRKDGTIRWKSVSSSLVRNNNGETKAVFLHFPDISDRRRAEAVVSEKEAKIRSIFSAAPVGIGLFINKAFHECNDTFYEMTGYSPEEIIGKDASILHPDKEQLLYVRREQTRQIKEKRVENIETKWRRKDGRIITILLRFVPFEVSDFAKGITFSAVDISERKEAEAEIVKLNEQLEKKVRERTKLLNEAIRDLETFAYSVSHDLRAPLRHITGFVKLMYSKIPDPTDSIVDYYNKIEGSSQRMSSMIDSLLSFSRVGRKELAISDIDLESLVYEIIDHQNPDIGKRNITWNISHLPNLRCDKNLIKLVFENLISNAIKYTSKKTDAIIEIGSGKTSENQIELYIKDNGIGFDMAHASKLFGVFQRLHSADEFEGIGIGLANVKQIIEKHKGTVRAEGKTNEGAVFYINLPK